MSSSLLKMSLKTYSSQCSRKRCHHHRQYGHASLVEEIPSGILTVASSVALMSVNTVGGWVGASRWNSRGFTHLTIDR
jgi:hypothetical protein